MRKNKMTKECSGKFTLRLPKKTHKQLRAIAEKEGTSLNTVLNVMVSAALAQRDKE
jgi:predicted HicB family RNase H-like nuclease